MLLYIFYFLAGYGQVMILEAPPQLRGPGQLPALPIASAGPPLESPKLRLLLHCFLECWLRDVLFVLLRTKIKSQALFK